MQPLSLRNVLLVLLEDLLGTYQFPGGATARAISINSPAPGVKAEGLEVVIAAVPEVKVAAATYIAGHSAVQEIYTVFLYQWSGSGLQEAQYRIAQNWPTAAFNPGPVVTRDRRIPSLQVDIMALGAALPCPSSGGTADFVFTQATPAAVWDITHNLGVYPTVSTQDPDLNIIEGDIDHVSVNRVRITFSVPVAGSARLS